MAVRATQSELIGIPLNPLPGPEVTTDGVIEVLGRLVGGLTPGDAELDDTGGTLRSLRVLALDNLVDIIALREQLAERATRIAELEQEVETWQDRAHTLSVARTAEKAAAHQRERELVTILHSTLTENASMQLELDWRRRPWWRRGRRPEPAVTPAQLLASAAR